MVLTILSAFTSCIGSEVEHIPYIGGPDIRAGEECLDHFLVVVCLILFCVIALLRLRSMPVESLAPILAAAYRSIGESLMKIIKPNCVVFYFSPIPTEVVVI